MLFATIKVQRTLRYSLSVYKQTRGTSSRGLAARVSPPPHIILLRLLLNRGYPHAAVAFPASGAPTRGAADDGWDLNSTWCGVGGRARDARGGLGNGRDADSFFFLSPSLSLFSSFVFFAAPQFISRNRSSLSLSLLSTGPPPLLVLARADYVAETL